MMQSILSRGVADLVDLLGQLHRMAPSLEQLGHAMLACWGRRGKVLVCGNGGSAADAMHMAEELAVRFQKDRRALAALALCDPTVLTCAGNDLGYEQVFSRQVEAYGNEGDVLVVLSTSGNSPNVLRAVEAARERKLLTCAFLGRDGGRLRGRCDVELLVPSPITARVQECHKLLFHTLCEWVEAHVE